LILFSDDYLGNYCLFFSTNGIIESQHFLLAVLTIILKKNFKITEFLLQISSSGICREIENSEWGLLSDKGKPAERQGRKAKCLRAKAYDRLVAEEQDFLLF
jgi:hypothetical protein